MGWYFVVVILYVEVAWHINARLTVWADSLMFEPHLEALHVENVTSLTGQCHYLIVILVVLHANAAGAVWLQHHV